MSAESGQAPGRPWRPYLVFAVVGLAAGLALTVWNTRVDVPDDCGDVLADYDAEALLRTQGSVSPDTERGNGMMTCTWQAKGHERDGIRRTSTVTVSVAKHPFFGADPAVERVRTYADPESTTTPAGLGDEAVVISAVRDGMAHAEVGVHDRMRSIRVVYTVDDGDRDMAAYLAELTARKAILDGPGL